MSSETCEGCGVVIDKRKEGIRIQRMLLTAVTGAGDGLIVARDEIGDCSYCWGRITAELLAMCAGNLLVMGGSQEAAAKFLEDQILTDLDGGDDQP